MVGRGEYLVIHLAYREHMINKNFTCQVLFASKVTINMRGGRIEYHRNEAEP
jgi:hypothetical protein